MKQVRTRDAIAALGSMALGFLAIMSVAAPQATSQSSEDAKLRLAFARPTSLPSPSGTPASPALIALGERLFNDPRLSGNGKIACATCHDIKLGLADGARLSTSGATARPLLRHTPALWNVAWVPKLMWDGRADDLERQAAMPMSHPDEMAGDPVIGAKKLAADPEMQRRFAEAYPGTPQVTPKNLLGAIAAYERTLVSPPTRFDRWVAGDAGALTGEERLGLSIFAGKGKCTNCHVGFAFTDHGFHDIGLPTSDRGRGPIAGVGAVDFAFKTPTLRELAWTAPYMHDGSLATIEDVVRHYEGGGVVRPGRSKDMPRDLRLTDEERAALVAFIETLSSDAAPRPSTEPWVQLASPPGSNEIAIGTTRVSQRDRQFMPGAIKAKRGDKITIFNDDVRTHNVRIASPELDFNSGAQEPGESVVLKLDKSGLFEAHCAIHPTMRLRIEVDE